MNRLASTALSLTLGSGLVMTLAPQAQAAPSIRAKAMSIAASHKGDPYREGGTGPRVFDCSGLTSYSYKKAGRTLPRTAQGQYNKVPHVSPAHRQKGDLIFIGTSSRSIYHVGIYVGFWSGKGWMLNANSRAYRGRKVVVAPVSEYTKGSPKAYYGRVTK